MFRAELRSVVMVFERRPELDLSQLGPQLRASCGRRAKGKAADAADGSAVVEDGRRAPHLLAAEDVASGAEADLSEESVVRFRDLCEFGLHRHASAALVGHEFDHLHLTLRGLQPLVKVVDAFYRLDAVHPRWLMADCRRPAVKKSDAHRADVVGDRCREHERCHAARARRYPSFPRSRCCRLVPPQSDAARATVSSSARRAVRALLGEKRTRPTSFQASHRLRKYPLTWLGCKRNESHSTTTTTTTTTR